MKREEEKCMANGQNLFEQMVYIFRNQTLQKILDEGFNPSDVTQSEIYLTNMIEGVHECMCFA